ncbi:hypothetical protein J437_LFUL017358 [Ladona fulva]|uniref:DDE Tnp4 domain-containing protein n=1 Tax=Ladona fulva TaxID=123851 RepID=A0A8K0KQR4_LADFU|nr:hypothetical protein J437_LFUL017358 [Ladona fulva]
MHGISQATMSRVANKVSLALAELRGEVMKYPSPREELMKAMAAFHKIKKFPRVSGCIECTHIRIKYSGGKDVATFLNRKNYCSLYIQIVGSADLIILYIVAKYSTHDVRIFNEWLLKDKFEMKIYVIGDGGYPCLPYY